MGTAGLVGVMIRASVFDITRKNMTSSNTSSWLQHDDLACCVRNLNCSIAKKKAEQLYDTQMKEYEILRNKWLEIATMKLERDAQNSMNPNVMVAPKVVDNKMVEIKTEPVDENGVQTKRISKVVRERPRMFHSLAGLVKLSYT